MRELRHLMRECTTKSRWRDLNPRPLDYESSALPLSHIGKAAIFNLENAIPEI